MSTPYPHRRRYPRLEAAIEFAVDLWRWLRRQNASR
jgi:hypothetical protein